MAYDSEHSPENPSFFCEQCFRALHYDEHGNKIGNFQAFRYFDKSAVIWKLCIQDNSVHLYCHLCEGRLIQHAYNCRAVVFVIFSGKYMLTRRSYQLCEWFLELCFINNMFAPIKVIQLFIDDGQIKPFTDTHISSGSDILPCRSGEFLYTLPPTCNYYYHIIHVLNGHSSFKANMNLYGLHDFFYIVHHLLWILNKYCVCIMSHFLFFAQIHRRTFNSVCLNFEFHLFWISFEISSQSLSWTLFVQICICLLSPWHFFKPGEYLKSKDHKRNCTCRPQISGVTKLKVYLSDGAFLLVMLSCK